jgi:anti-sigma-K factor RskA
MAEELIPPGSAEDELVLQAMLYASGELDAEQAAAFEVLLTEDQAARDALCKAVELTQSLPGQESAPDPAYRSRVRHRLRQRRRHRQGLQNQDGSFTQHPAFWSVFGAAIAVLLMVLISFIVAHISTTPPTAPSSQPQPGGQRSSIDEQAGKLAEQLSKASATERTALQKQLMDLAQKKVQGEADKLVKDQFNAWIEKATPPKN